MVALVCRNNKSTRYAAPLQSLKHQFQLYLHHALFQRYYYGEVAGKDHNAREVYKDQPHYQACIDFCEKYEQCAFDRNYQAKPAAFFLPLVQRVMQTT